MHGEWGAAKYARAYHRNHSQKRQSPDALAFLYRDVQDESTGEWRSEPHRVAKRTRKYVYGEKPETPIDCGEGEWQGGEFWGRQPSASEARSGFSLRKPRRKAPGSFTSSSGRTNRST